MWVKLPIKSVSVNHERDKKGVDWLNERRLQNEMQKKTDNRQIACAVKLVTFVHYQKFLFLITVWYYADH